MKIYILYLYIYIYITLIWPFFSKILILKISILGYLETFFGGIQKKGCLELEKKTLGKRPLFFDLSNFLAKKCILCKNTTLTKMQF